LVRLRTAIQTVFTAVTNGYYQGFAHGRIYQGDLKNMCLPGLNCYSCPGALGSCPIGSLQAVADDRRFSVSFYVLGFLAVAGVLMGRFVCGWLCPFGLFQDLLDRIPFVKKIRHFRADRYLKWLKYIILLVFVMILPMFFVNDFGQGEPWFCKYICPSGTLMAGWPLLLLNEGLRKAAGFLFVWKSFILVMLIFLSVVIYRPFCRWLCPLGAIYGMFNKVSFYRYYVDKNKCTECGECEKVCKLGIQMYNNPDSTECIRCGECMKECLEGAISSSVMKVRTAVKHNGDIQEK